MTDRRTYEVVVVGGGPAGLTTALYTTRLGHRTAVFEVAGGRHASASHVHNLYGVSEDVSGRELAKHAADQFEEYGGTYFLDRVEDIRESDDGSGDAGAGNADGRNGGEVNGGEPKEDEGRFVVDAEHATVTAERVVFATGFTDVGPSVPGLERFTGRGLHYCLHCDAYTLADGPVFVLGHDDHAASVALLMLNFTADVDLLLDGREPEWSEDTERQLRAHPVDRIDEAVVGAFAREGGGGDHGDGTRGWTGEWTDDGTRDSTDDVPWLGGLRVADDEGAHGDERAATATDREYLGGFAVYGTEYNTKLAESLGCELAQDGALVVDDDFETSVDGAYAVGDVTHGQNQTVVALGDGAKAGIALHKDLRHFPITPDDLDTVEADSVPAAPADLRARMRSVRTRKRHAGLRGPPPDR